MIERKRSHQFASRGHFRAHSNGSSQTVAPNMNPNNQNNPIIEIEGT